MDEKINKMIALVIVVMVWLGLSIMSPAKADVVTMDVVKHDGMGSSGTWRCEDFYQCYLIVLSGEYRNQTSDCKTITIKRNGRVIWHRDYNDPYWKSMQQSRN